MGGIGCCCAVQACASCMCESVEVFFGACVSLRYRLSSAAVYLQEENNFTLKLRVRKNTDGGGGGCCSNFCPQFKKYTISIYWKHIS